MPRLALLAIVCLVAAAPAVRAGLVKPDDAALASAPMLFPYKDWDALLAKYVDDKGRVDYNRLKASAEDVARLERLFAAVAAGGPKKNADAYKTRQAKEAFYLNAYNVLVWKNVLPRVPKLTNVDKEKASFFYITDFLVSGDKYNLLDLEKKVVRPMFKDGRIHMALNCASGGCPQLPRDAFVPEKLDAQLDREARKFCGEARNVNYDAGAKKLKLSKIFDWYREDFGGDSGRVIEWINNFHEPQIPTDVKIEYVDYDWTLNDVNVLKR